MRKTINRLYNGCILNVKPAFVVLSTGFYPYNYGGLATQTLALSSFIQSKGCTVTVISQKPGGSMKVFEKGLIRTVFIPLKSQSKLSSLFFITISLLYILSLKCKNLHRPVIVHSMQFLRSGFAAGLSKFLGVQVTSTWIAGEELTFSKLPLKFCARLLDLIIVQKKDDLKVVRSFSHSKPKVFLLRGGVNHELFRNDIESRILNIIKNLRKRHLNLVWVGRVTPEKDPLTLLYACKILKKRNVSFRLKIIGSGELLKTVSKKTEELSISKHVRVLGYLPWSRTIKEIRKADILVTSSFAEGLPNVLAEAMATGLLIVSTPAGAIKEIIMHNQNGFIFPFGRYDRLADTLEALTRYPPIAIRKIILNARAFAERELKGSDVYQRLVDLFLSNLRSN